MALFHCRRILYHWCQLGSPQNMRGCQKDTHSDEKQKVQQVNSSAVLLKICIPTKIYLSSQYIALCI